MEAVKDDQAVLPGDLHQSREQILRYARDLKLALWKERERSTELSTALTSLNALTGELEQTLQSERTLRLELEQAYREMFLRLVQASRFKDQETGRHMERISRYTLALARHLGVEAEEARIMAAASPLHDLGKVGLPDEILRKPGPLTPAERRQMEEHTTIGAELLRGSRSRLIRMASEIALTHHERWDGTGYPRGLRGEQIPPAGRIVMLADQYDALRSRRHYKPPYCHATTCAIIREGDGRTCPEHFDPAVLEAFRDLDAVFDKIFNECADAGELN